MDGYDAAGERVYDRVAGKTCHQCRQKTIGKRTRCIECQSADVRSQSPGPHLHPPLSCHACPLVSPEGSHHADLHHLAAAHTCTAGTAIAGDPVTP